MLDVPKTLLYADILGVKALWNASGPSGVILAYQRLEALVEAAFLVAPPIQPFRGGVQSDALAVVFESTEDAVRFGSALFRAAWDGATEKERTWLRGVVVPWDEKGPDFWTTHPPLANGSVDVVAPRRSLLAAINAEQRFKGPRLLIDDGLVTQALRNSLAVPCGTLHFVPLKRLTFASYPVAKAAAQLKDDWLDVLYLAASATPTRAEIERTEEEMGQRLKWAGRVSEELAQVAALAGTWFETRAIMQNQCLRGGAWGPPVPPA